MEKKRTNFTIIVRSNCDKKRTQLTSPRPRPQTHIVSPTSASPSSKRKKTHHDAETKRKPSMPSGRWGHTLTPTGASTLVLLGGEGTGHDLVRDIGWTFKGLLMILGLFSLSLHPLCVSLRSLLFLFQLYFPHTVS